MTEKAQQSKTIIFRCSPETAALLSQIAAAEGKSRSEVLRLLVEKGLAAGGYLPGIQGIDGVVRESVGAAIQPAVERLAAISAKAAHISAAAFFMALYTDRLLLPRERQGELEEMAAKARRLGIEYLRVAKDTDLDAWIAQASGRMK